MMADETGDSSPNGASRDHLQFGSFDDEQVPLLCPLLMTLHALRQASSLGTVSKQLQVMGDAFFLVIGSFRAVFLSGAGATGGGG